MLFKGAGFEGISRPHEAIPTALLINQGQGKVGVRRLLFAAPSLLRGRRCERALGKAAGESSCFRHVHTSPRRTHLAAPAAVVAQRRVSLGERHTLYDITIPPSQGAPVEQRAARVVAQLGALAVGTHPVHAARGDDLGRPLVGCQVFGVSGWSVRLERPLRVDAFKYTTSKRHTRLYGGTPPGAESSTEDNLRDTRGGPLTLLYRRYGEGPPGVDSSTDAILRSEENPKTDTTLGSCCVRSAW